MISAVDRLLGRTESSASIAWRTMVAEVGRTGALRFAGTVIGGLAVAVALYVISPV